RSSIHRVIPVATATRMTIAQRNHKYRHAPATVSAIAMTTSHAIVIPTALGNGWLKIAKATTNGTSPSASTPIDVARTPPIAASTTDVSVRTRILVPRRGNWTN